VGQLALQGQRPRATLPGEAEAYDQDAAFFAIWCFDGGDEVAPAWNLVGANRDGSRLDAPGHPAQEGGNIAETLDSLLLHGRPPRAQRSDDSMGRAVRAVEGPKVIRPARVTFGPSTIATRAFTMALMTR